MSDWLLPIVAVLLIGYGAVSRRLQRSVITQAMVFAIVGLVIGNRFLHLVDLAPASVIIRYLAEATLAVVLFTDAVRVRLPRLRHEAAVPVRLLGIGLPLTIIAGTVVGMLVFPDLNLWTAAALATMLAPTDAALGLPVISNRKLPSRIRQGLNVESGLNDGVCVPLLIIFLTLAAAEEDSAHIEPVRILLEEIGFGAVGGIVAGVLGAWVLRHAVARGWANPELAADRLGRDASPGLHGRGRTRRQRLHRRLRRRDRLPRRRRTGRGVDHAASRRSPASCSTP